MLILYFLKFPDSHFELCKHYDFFFFQPFFFFFNDSQEKRNYKKELTFSRYNEARLDFFGHVPESKPPK